MPWAKQMSKTNTFMLYSQKRKWEDIIGYGYLSMKLDSKYIVI
jgi:hypothetical protein